MYAEEYEEKVQVKVLDCDTISQVKGKILDALYRNTPQTLRPSVHEVDLGKCHNCLVTVQLVLKAQSGSSFQNFDTVAPAACPSMTKIRRQSLNQEAGNGLTRLPTTVSGIRL